MIALFVTFNIKPGCMEEFINVSLANSRGSINGSGCFATSIIPDPNKQNVAYVFEVFANEEALDSHHQSDYYKKWEQESAKLMNGNYTYIKNSNFPEGDGMMFLKRAAGA